jgi:hypothetical protein
MCSAGSRQLLNSMNVFSSWQQTAAEQLEQLLDSSTDLLNNSSQQLSSSRISRNSSTRLLDSSTQLLRRTMQLFFIRGVFIIFLFG